MAARRLIIIMLVLLGISTLLAAALPDRVRDTEEENAASETSATATEAAGKEPTGDEQQALSTRRLKPVTINADEGPAVIKLEAGQQLPLTVLSSTEDLVEIQRIGFVDAVGPYKPATFDILTGRPGAYAIRLVNADRRIGRLEVTPGSAAGEAAQGAE
jgi:hypothetical protein